MPIVTIPANIRIQAQADEDSGNRNTEAVEVDQRALQFVSKRGGRSLFGNGKAFNVFRSGQKTRKRTTPRYSSGLSGYDGEAIASRIRSFLSKMQRWCFQKRISEIQISKQVALSSIQRGASKWYSRIIFFCSKNNGRKDSVQSAQEGGRPCKNLPNNQEAERVHASCSLHSNPSQFTYHRSGCRVGFWSKTPNFGQRREEGGKSQIPHKINASIENGSEKDKSPKEGQPKEKKSLSIDGQNTRENFKSEKGLFSQNCKVLRKHVRHNRDREFVSVKHDSKPLFFESNNGRIMGDASEVYRGQSRKCWAFDNRSKSEVDIPEMLRVWSHCSEIRERENAFVLQLWVCGLPRHECCQKYFKAGDQPSGRGCNSGSNDLRSIGEIR